MHTTLQLNTLLSNTTPNHHDLSDNIMNCFEKKDKSVLSLKEVKNFIDTSTTIISAKTIGLLLCLAPSMLIPSLFFHYFFYALTNFSHSIVNDIILFLSTFSITALSFHILKKIFNSIAFFNFNKDKENIKLFIDNFLTTDHDTFITTIQNTFYQKLLDKNFEASSPFISSYQYLNESIYQLNFSFKELIYSLKQQQLKQEYHLYPLKDFIDTCSIVEHDIALMDDIETLI